MRARRQHVSRAKSLLIRTAQTRRGSIVLLTVFFLILGTGLVALSLDVGVLLVARTELQRSADSAAMAAASALAEESASPNMVRLAREAAMQFAGANVVGQIAPSLTVNVSNAADGDVVMGYLPPPWTQPMDLAQAARPNAVTVRVKRTKSQNGEIPLFFAPILGVQSSAIEAEATAAFVPVMRGFKPPQTESENVPMLPFTLHVERWHDLMNGDGSDDFTWDASAREVKPGADGIREVRLFPNNTGAPGNSGIVDIGSEKSHADDLRRQILDGLSPDDLAYHGGELKLDMRGELPLSGNPGLKLGIVDPPLNAIVGEPRMIPLYREVARQGQNAHYTIVAFAGVRIVEVALKGGDKRLMVQPAPVIIRGGIPDQTGAQSSYFIYSPVCLVR